MKTCPYCAEEIQDAAIVCRYCNRPQPGHEKEVPPAIEEPKSNRTTIAIVGVAVILIAGMASFMLFGGNGLRVNILPTPTVTPVPTAESCYHQSENYRIAVTSLIAEWDDAESVANSTSRIALSPAVAELQRIRREAEDLDLPECAEFAHAPLISYMDAVIEAFLLFMADEPDSEVSNKFREATNQLDRFSVEFNKIKVIPTAAP